MDRDPSQKISDDAKEISTEEQKKSKVGRPKKVKDTTKGRSRKEKSKARRKTDKVFKKHLKTTSAEIREDPDLEKEIEVLGQTGLKNQVHTLQLSRLCGMYCIVLLNFISTSC